MEPSEVDWAGVSFLPLFHHDGRFFRQPGLFAFVRRERGARTLLFVDHADSIAAATQNHRLWADALRLGFNELNVNTQAVERIDRLILRGRIVRRCGPLLNLLEEGEAAYRHEKARPPPRCAGRLS